MVVTTLLEECGKNVRKAPGWIPLLVACYLLLPLLSDYLADLGIDFQAHKVVIVTSFAFTLYVVGDALDQAIFPRKTENGMRGYQWLAPRALSCSQDKAKRALLLKCGYYEVSKSLAIKAGKYSGSWIQVKNELAKFIRSTVLPMAGVSLLLLLRNQFAWGICAFVASPVLLILYGRLKGWHMCDLYELAARLSKKDDYYKVHDLKDGVRLFFWRGKFVCSGVRKSPQEKPTAAVE